MMSLPLEVGKSTTTNTLGKHLVWLVIISNTTFVDSWIVLKNVRHKPPRRTWFDLNYKEKKIEFMELAVLRKLLGKRK